MTWFTRRAQSRRHRGRECGLSGDHAGPDRADDRGCAVILYFKNTAWGSYHPEFYPTYDDKAVGIAAHYKAPTKRAPGRRAEAAMRID